MDTSALPALQARALWLDHIGVMFDARLRDREGPGVHAQAKAFLIDAVAVAKVCMGAQQFDRSPRKIAKDGLDHYLLQFYTSGRCGRRVDGLHHATQPGDLWVTDLSQPLMTEITPASCINLVIPRARIAHLLKQPDAHHQRIIKGHQPLVRMLLGHVQTVFECGAHIALAQAPQIQALSVSLAAAVLNEAVTPDVAPQVQHALKVCIRRHIQDNLESPTLDAVSIANSFGISVRKLHYLFEPENGVSLYIRQSRMRRGWSMLRDPEMNGCSISDIASKCGFSNIETFSRNFQQFFDISARSLRSLADPSTTQQSCIDEWKSKNWGQWITMLE